MATLLVAISLRDHCVVCMLDVPVALALRTNGRLPKEDFGIIHARRMLFTSRIFFVSVMFTLCRRC